MSLCSPALLYFIIGIIAIVSMVYSKVPMQTVAMKGLFIAIWTLFLNFLCSKGHESISWFLVILPFVVMALVIVAMSNIIGGKLSQQKEMFSNSDYSICDYFKSRKECCYYYPEECITSLTYTHPLPNCKEYPNSPGCPEYCLDHPNDPSCGAHYQL
jgi:hypothetical protein